MSYFPGGVSNKFMNLLSLVTGQVTGRQRTGDKVLEDGVVASQVKYFLVCGGSIIVELTRWW